MFCRMCGHKLANDAVFCPKCGTKVITINNSSDQDYRAQIAAAAADSYRADKSLSTDNPVNDIDNYDDFLSYYSKKG